MGGSYSVCQDSHDSNSYVVGNTSDDPTAVSFFQPLGSDVRPGSVYSVKCVRPGDGAWYGQPPFAVGFVGPLPTDRGFTDEYDLSELLQQDKNKDILEKSVLMLSDGRRVSFKDGIMPYGGQVTQGAKVKLRVTDDGFICVSRLRKEFGILCHSRDLCPGSRLTVILPAMCELRVTCKTEDSGSSAAAQSSTSGISMLDLPDDIVQRIALFSVCGLNQPTPDAVRAMRLVCRSWKRAIDVPHLFQQLSRSRWSVVNLQDALVAEQLQGVKTWTSYYMHRHHKAAGLTRIRAGFPFTCVTAMTRNERDPAMSSGAPPHPILSCENEWEFQCPLLWETLGLTDDSNVRFCDQCKRQVTFCHSEEEVNDHVARGHCVAYDPDFETREMPRMMGRMAPMRGRGRISSDEDSD